jgi:acyl-CoA reductase-like NAD-dependent aldehyde dehydrogenase
MVCRADHLADVTNEMRLTREEVFGPVLSAIRNTVDEAIAIANGTPFGSLALSRSRHASASENVPSPPLP